MSNLVKALEDGAAATAGPICYTSVTNGTPADWGVVIVGAAVEYAYDDGSTSQDVEPNCNLHTNQSVVLNSQPKCVKNQHVVLRVEVDGGTQVFDKMYPTAAGKCAIKNDVILAPASSIPEGEFSAAASKRARHLELT